MLALNPEKQEKLRAEVFELLPNIDSKFTEYSFDHSPYFRGALKESMRLHPLNPGNMRGAGEDLVLDGYQIPKNVSILSSITLLYFYFQQIDDIFRRTC